MKHGYQILESAIKKAGERAQAIRATGLSITIKGRQDFVSEADVFVENELKQTINTLYPNDALLGEESGLTAGHKNKTAGIWVIDPIDGTTNYMQNMDYWCISVAYVVNEIIQVGFVYAPDRDELFFAQRNKGAYLNGVKLTINEPDDGQAIIGIGRSNRRPLQEYFKILTTLDSKNIEHRRFGAGALMLAHVSSGLVHGYYESHLNSWDALAGLLLINEAGGKTNDFLANKGLINGNLTWAASPRLWLDLHEFIE